VSTPTHLRTAVTRRVPVAAFLLLVALVLGGCRSADRAAASPVVEPGGPLSTGSPTAASADPLADVEATVDAAERDVDADAGAAGR